MSNKKLLTVIVLSYNSGALIYDTLASILDQTYDSIEIIIADDSSKSFDQTKLLEFIELKRRDNIKNVIIYSNEYNLGTVKNINKAIKNSNGAYINIIAGDDVYYDHKVFEKQINHFNENNNCLIVTGKSLSVSYNLEPVADISNELTNKYYGDILSRISNDTVSYLWKRNINILSTQSCCFSKDYFTEYGLYDENYMLLEDLPMMIRIVKSGIKVGFLESYVVKHRQGAGVSSSRRLISASSYKYYCDMLNFIKSDLKEYRNSIGIVNYRNRLKIYQFRVDYAHLIIQKESNYKKNGIIIRNLNSLAYYTIKRGVRSFMNKLNLRYELWKNLL